MAKRLEINVGDNYGRLSIIREVEPKIFKSGKIYRAFLVVCECGTKKEKLLQELRRGLTVSCGCYNSEIHMKHGFAKTSLYHSWGKMFSVPTNKSSDINTNLVCKDWHVADNFVKWAISNGYETGDVLIRIDKNKAYSPNNCIFTIKSYDNMYKKAYGKVKYKGVYFDKVREKYSATIKHNGISKHLGRYDTAIEAAKVYDKYVIDNNLPQIVNLNF